MAKMKPGSPFLYDETTGDIVGVKDADGGEGYFAKVTTDASNNVIGVYGGPAGTAARMPYVVEMSAVAANLTGTTNETTLATIAVPAMGPKDAIRVRMQWSYTNSANLKTMVAKLNNSTFAQTSTSTSGNTIAAQEVTVMNRNATNSQIGSLFGSGLSTATSGSFISPSVETSGANTIIIRGQLASAAETITLESYIVELLRGGA